jgi:carbamoyl-phosphate synthase large subunit
MKAVGEVMAIGRSFQEALQKACQSLENNRIGLGADGKTWVSADDMLKGIKVPSWDRIFRIYDALKLGNAAQDHTGHHTYRPMVPAPDAIGPR